ncbi:class I SAM-dependent DNA methyltransferase [Dyadobacter sp. Leaf189]|uniref:HsdM family class I SAM-dependent methyltransferase n=1 Tax=Dyadobacter sp. Leaf189 TaxID=1736295 RepID=UPI0006F55CC4|nr:class I SAM-dependent DNA methyltransferase [Dyadobacter sp. Leaf189]KQS33837.1 N-6 DNA methylase [Dyadobacter sp. Leaf189]
MTQDIQFVTKTKNLIDSLKSVCANYGLGNSAGEFDIIIQCFLYKIFNDRFGYEVRKDNNDFQHLDPKEFSDALSSMTEEDYKFMLASLDPNVPRLKPYHLIGYLYNNQNAPEFGKLFDDTLVQISTENADVFSVKSFNGVKDILFDRLSQQFIRDSSERDAFCRAIINKMVDFNFETSFDFLFEEKYDFFKDIFEYLIKDYNSDSGGKYAEYYTPNAVARIIASILVDSDEKGNKKCYDPSVGSGSLLMSLAHKIGEDKCTIYSEDISQKSSVMLRLNLILNNLTHSIPNVIKTNTISQPFYLGKQEFDYVVSNPPFKLDFSDFRGDLEKDSFRERFFAGIPKIPNKDKDKMAIYLLFIQHIMFSLNETGKAAIVVPTGFITAQGSIEKKIRERLVDKSWLRGVVSMPSNIFASTGTNVSVLFIDKEADGEQIVLMDASKLGADVKEGKNQRTVLSRTEEMDIVNTFNSRQAVENLSVVVTKEQIKEKNYSFSAGQYFEVKIDYVDITAEEFASKMQGFEERLNTLFAEGNKLDKEIVANLKQLKLS